MGCINNYILKIKNCLGQILENIENFEFRFKMKMLRVSENCQSEVCILRLMILLEGLFL